MTAPIRELSRTELAAIDLGCFNVWRRLAKSGDSSDNMGVENASTAVFVCHQRAIPYLAAAAFSTNEANTVGDGLLRSEVEP